MTVSPTRTSFASHLVLVVQRRVGHRDAADEHRLEPRDRRQRAGAADLHFDRRATCVVASSAGNLCATAQRGARETNPSRSCSVSAFTL